MKKLLFIIIAFLSFNSSALAANHYINAACASACDGSTWTKGWATFGAAATAGYVRGDTYYVAGGAYNEGVEIAAAESGSSLITIKKANASDNSGDDDWSSAYATNQVVITSLLISNGYVTINGVTGSGNGSTETYGIKVYSATSSNGNAIVNLEYASSQFTTLSYIEFQGTGFDAANGWSAIKQNNGSSPTKGTHISHCYIHDFSQNGVAFVGVVGTSWSDYGLLFENNYLYNIGGTTAGSHGQSIQCGSGASTDSQSYWIIRNNVFDTMYANGILSCLGGSQNSYIDFYNNVTTNPQQSINGTTMIWKAWQSLSNPFTGTIFFSPSEGTTADHIRILNNTFHNACNAQLTFSAPTQSNLEAKNNLWVTPHFTYDMIGTFSASNNDYYGCEVTIDSGHYGCPYTDGGTEGTVTIESSPPVTNAASGNFHLVSGASAITGGANLTSYGITGLNSDKDGTARPSSGAWDIGAYQYGEGEADTTAPSVTITQSSPQAISANSLAISGTASDAVGVSSCKYRLGSAPDASNGTALTGTTSWSGTVTTFSSGANTLYAGCTDAAGNWGSANITVNYTPPAAPSICQGCTISGGSVH